MIVSRLTKRKTGGNMKNKMTKSEMISYLTNWGVYYENLLWNVCPLTLSELRAEVEFTRNADNGVFN